MEELWELFCFDSKIKSRKQQNITILMKFKEELKDQLGGKV